jgi:hypothetical protein
LEAAIAAVIYHKTVTLEEETGTERGKRAAVVSVAYGGGFATWGLLVTDKEDTRLSGGYHLMWQPGVLAFHFSS